MSGSGNEMMRTWEIIIKKGHCIWDSLWWPTIYIEEKGGDKLITPRRHEYGERQNEISIHCTENNGVHGHGIEKEKRKKEHDD